ncbi:MAG: hypothetical protein DRN29_03610 [Thermoplasmata archaeon]|nr:MAG: hypothetical protein DRN29_03610 [Thermoplasmata archaeon]
MRKLVAIGAVAVLAILAGCAEKGTTVTMSLKELNDDFDYELNNATFYYHSFFKSLDPGDTLIIKDEIAEKRVSGNYTLLLFTSLPNGGLYFDGNLTDFNAGDSIEVTVHIEKDIFERQNAGQTWTFEMEVLKEGWDFEQHTTKALPPDTIKHI